ncbi:MAG: aminomethyl-transferring glycine dehydrogenase subunit GcvPB [Bacteroidales bacterium]|nr:aminomethyl-transferring glycine dehydrogenase subunit GcvPB [Bacteroidales bacterium]
MKYYDKLIFDLSKEGRQGYSLPANKWQTSLSELPAGLLREQDPELPQVSELDVVRHYTNLSQMNFGVDSGFYPLGSCTMKYNPKINEEIASMPAFAGVHPLQPSYTVQGVLRVYKELAKALSAITGMAEFTLNPFAGAHGELTGLMIIRQYHISRGDLKRTRIIVPDSAHGTNPASAAVCGLEIVQVKSKANGLVDVEDLKPLLDDTIAGIMMTNPNTLGLFEKDIKEIAALVHECGGLLYYDGANMNPLMGVVRPGDMGFDVLHLNLHKTFSTPHGGGGPGAGPVGVAEHLIPYLPVPRVVEDEEGTLYVEDEDGQSCGRISGFMGNFGVLLRAYTYILMLGKQNVRMVGPLAVLGANYIKESLRDCYNLPIDSVCKHEFVFDGLLDQSTGVTTLDIAKRLLDYGFHAPTIYFPLLFHQSIMIEPTETESKETLDGFIEIMRHIAAEAASDPDSLKTAPHTTPVRRLDETTAARQPVLRYRDMNQI